MRRCILLAGLLAVISCDLVAASSAELAPVRSPRLVELFKNRLKDLWMWMRSLIGPAEDTFMGRCFGLARKLRFAIPLIVFKLGVVITILAFLTIFSLKSITLLVLLLLINSSGLAAKFAWWKGHEEEPRPQWKSPQNFHVHIHQNKDGQFNVAHPEPSYEGWFDKSSLIDRNSDNLDNRLDLLNVDDYRKR